MLHELSWREGGIQQVFVSHNLDHITTRVWIRTRTDSKLDTIGCHQGCKIAAHENNIASTHNLFKPELQQISVCDLHLCPYLGPWMLSDPTISDIPYLAVT